MEGPSTSTSSGGRFFFGVLFTISELLLFGSVSLFVYWVIWHDTGFAWSKNRNEQFNLHAILMIIGFVFLNGQAITIGMVAGIQAQHNMAPGATIRHFYSLHSWVGLVAIGLFALQFVAGFVSFLILLCCDKATANFRARLLPTHVTFGLIIYSLAVIASISGLLQVARSRLSGKEGKPNYKEFEEPTIIINAVGCCLIGLAILLPYIIRNCGQRSRHSPNFHISH